MQQLKELYEQALGDIQKKDEQVDKIRSQLEETTESLQSQEKAAQEVQSKCQSTGGVAGCLLQAGDLGLRRGGAETLPHSRG